MLVKAVLLTLLAMQCKQSQAYPNEIDAVAAVSLPTFAELEASISENFPLSNHPLISKPFDLFNFCSVLPFIPFCIGNKPGVIITVEVTGSQGTVSIFPPAVTTIVGATTLTVTRTTSTSTTCLATPTTVVGESTATVTVTASPYITTVTQQGPSTPCAPTVTIQPNPSCVTITPTLTNTASANVVVTVTPATSTCFWGTTTITVNVIPTATVTVDAYGNPVHKSADFIELLATKASQFSEEVRPTVMAVMEKAEEFAEEIKQSIF